MKEEKKSAKKYGRTEHIVGKLTGPGRILLRELTTRATACIIHIRVFIVM